MLRLRTVALSGFAQGRHGMLRTMNPFDAPPSTPAVSYESPRPPKRGRARMIGAVVLGAGLVGAGAVGVSALDSGDDRESPGPSSAAAPVARGDDSLVRTAARDDRLGEDDLRGLHECLGLPEVWVDAPFGEEFDLEELPALDELFGDELFGDDFALDELLGDDFALDELFGEFEGEFPMFEEWTADGELPALDELFGDDFSLDELFGEFEGEFPMFEEWTADDASVPPVPGDLETLLDDVDGLVMLMGPDGPVVIDLGEGDGAVTIERDGETGTVTITTDGGAAEVGLDELFDEMIVPLIPDDIQDCLDGLDTDET